jgi:signal transduction histidine kinase
MNTPAHHHILYLDDEEDNLLIFRATFRREFTVFTASTIADARKILEEHEIHVVITDQRMPEMSGVDFLASIATQYPDAVYMIVTGYSDAEAIIRAINRVGIFRYLTKPWEAEDFRMAIRAALGTYSLRRQNKDLINSLQERNQALEQTNADLLRTNRELDEYVYRISHEVRAPVASVSGIMNLLRLENQEDIEVLHRYIGLITDNVLRLDNYTRSILQHFQISNYEETAIDINFNEMIDLCLEEIGAKPNGIGRFKVERQISLNGQAFSAQEGYLETIFRNLITNAIEYADTDRAECFLRIEIQATDTQLLLTFTDNGVGIPASAQSKIFNMFYRASESSSGPGLGLYIVKLAVERLGGQISFDSTEGVGSTFLVTLPLSPHLHR